MANTETTRNAARQALEAYQACEGLGGNGDETDLVDLIADLMHLADTFTGDDETYGGYCAERALEHYSDETGDDGESDDDVG